MLKGDLQSQKKSHIEKEAAKDCWLVIYSCKRTSGGGEGSIYFAIEMFRREISLEYPCKKQQKGNTLKNYEKYPCAQLQESYILFIFSLFLFDFIFILKYKVIFSNCFSIIFFRWRTN